MLTERQNQIVIGSLLGDGTIWTNFIDPLMKWNMSQSRLDYIGIDKKNYLCWYAREFIDVGVSIRLYKTKPTGTVKTWLRVHQGDLESEYQKYTFNTRCSKLWNEIESRWYVPRTDHPTFRRRKVLPVDIKLTPLSLCVWYMDDGSNYQKNANIELHTQGFTLEEVEFLIERLKKDLDIIASKKAAAKTGQYKIYVGRKSYFDFIDVIKPHVEWDCFNYKIDTSKYTRISNKGENHGMSILTEDKVREIFKLRDEGMLQKDISKKMGVSNICAILAGEQWSHLGLSRPKKKNPRLTKEIKQKIVALELEGLSQNQIAMQLNINQSTVSRILKKGKPCQELNSLQM